MSRRDTRRQEREIKRQVAKLKTQGAVDLKAPPPEVRPLTISLGYCWNEGRGVSGFWHQSILKLLVSAARKGIRIREIPVESGPFLSKARNMIADAFLRTEDEYLLMTDTDMVFEGHDLGLLLEADAAIAGALYYTAATGSAPWCTALEADPEHQDTYRPVDQPEPPLPPDPRQFGEDGEEEFRAAVAAFEEALEGETFQPRPVAAVGMGLTLIKRAAVEDVRRIYEHPFEFLGTAGEDLTFCLRAAEYGHETVLVPRARIGHVKVEVL